jgi:hypothetical protein
MTGKKYILTSELIKGEIVFKYNLKGYLSSVEIAASGMKLEVFNWIWENLPKTTKEVDEYIQRAKNFRIQEVPEDLSFERFWLEYGHKVGKKMMTQNAWKKLSQHDKIAALIYIPKLKKIKEREGTQMPYPQTYLNQKYWEV